MASQIFKNDERRLTVQFKGVEFSVVFRETGATLGMEEHTVESSLIDQFSLEECEAMIELFTRAQAIFKTDPTFGIDRS